MYFRFKKINFFFFLCLFFSFTLYVSSFLQIQQLGDEDKLRVDNIQATPVIQPVPDSVNTVWDKITQRASLNKEGDISWKQILECTGDAPPLSKDQFQSYTAGEATLSALGLIKLKEKQAVNTL